MASEREEADVKRHPIQVASRRTGLGVDRLRAWEKRYGVVEPARSETGRRRYSDADIEHLRLLHRAIQGGRRIGQVAGLTTAELADLVREDERQEAEVAVELADEEGPGVGDFVEDALSAVLRLDARELESVLGRATVTLGATTLIERVAAPLMVRIGDRWCDGELSPAHEHLASAVVRRVLGAVAEVAEPLETAPRVVVATPVGHLHEFGALFVAATAATQGWSVTYLGADLPAADIARIARETGARVVALSLVYPSGDPAVAEDLRALRESLPPDVTLLAGGRAAASYMESLDAIDAIHLEDIESLRFELIGLL